MFLIYSATDNPYRLYLQISQIPPYVLHHDSQDSILRKFDTYLQDHLQIFLSIPPHHYTFFLFLQAKASYYL